MGASTEIKRDKGRCIGMEEDMETSEGNLRAKTEDESLANIWQELDLALQSLEVFSFEYLSILVTECIFIKIHFFSIKI